MHKGSCHCGQVRYTVDAGEIPAMMECNCSHCQRKGYLLWFVPRAQFTLTAGEGQTGEYLFNKHKIRHQFCTTCGCQGFAYGTGPDGTEMAAVNVRCCPDINIETIKRVPVDGKSL